MLLNDRHKNPVRLNHIYADWEIIRKDRTKPFPLNYTNGLCKVIKLDQENHELSVRYELSGSVESGRNKTAIALGKRLIPLTDEEVSELIKDRNRRTSFLEEYAHKIGLLGHPAP